MNRITIMGRIGGDPEIKKTAGGVSVCSFSLATTEKYTDSNGVKKENTEWHRCVAWKRSAEVIAQMCCKGGRIIVDGKMTYREWEQDGQKRRNSEVVVKDFTIIDFRERVDSSPQYDQTPQYNDNAPAGFNPDDELPF